MAKFTSADGSSHICWFQECHVQFLALVSQETILANYCLQQLCMQQEVDYSKCNTTWPSSTA